MKLTIIFKVNLKGMNSCLVHWQPILLLIFLDPRGWCDLNLPRIGLPSTQKNDLKTANYKQFRDERQWKVLGLKGSVRVQNWVEKEIGMGSKGL